MSEEQTTTEQVAEAQPTKLVKIGDIVHYVLPNGRYAGEHRPAIVVRMWGTPTPTYEPTVQLQVFTDGSNDFCEGPIGPGLLWATSVQHNEDQKLPHTWHWPEE